MEHEFWHERWENNQIGFHIKQPHPYLIQHVAQLVKHSDSDAPSVFVPLCGKSPDLIWLAAQGFRVLGIELSEIAIRDFFSENGLSPKKVKQGKFTVWQHDSITLLQGDFFDLSTDDLMGCHAIYDRAALIALPPEMQVQYIDHLEAMLPKPCSGLLICLDYPQEQKAGPPFSIASAQVYTLFTGQAALKLQRKDVLDAHAHFRDKGMQRLHEEAYAISFS